MQLTRGVVIGMAFLGTSLAYGARAASVLAVPFVSQAPFGDWSQPYQDFCEEASAVMAAHFIWGVPVTPKIADTEMRIMKRFEELVLDGKSRDTSIDEAASILRVLYGFKHITTKIIQSPEEIKNELSVGRLVIAPASGELLNNPYFRKPAPLYHMIVVRGFDDAKNVFITNDPGTRRGNGLAYNQSILWNAIHDWNHGDVLYGEKKVMVIGR